jgi:hypothetical protein
MKSKKNIKSRVIFQYEKNGPFVKEWPSITAASAALNISQQSISNCLSGRSTAAGGYDWLYEKLGYGIDNS